MKLKPPNVYFYIPSDILIAKINLDINCYWGWIHNFIKNTPADLPDNLGKCWTIGPYNWTVQTYIYLKSLNYKYKITSTLDVEGIIISHGDFLPRYIKPISNRYIVEIKPDRSLSSILSNFVITQNASDPISRGYRRLFIHSHYVDYWPQPSIIKRNKLRGRIFKNICYMGKPEQFLSNVDYLKRELKKIDLNFYIVPIEKWNDYSQVDVIVAVRPVFETDKKKFSSNLSLNKKPASKLINAWIAGVPAILSPDSAFLKQKKSEFDFLEARNADELVSQIRRLNDNPELIDKMIKNGFERAKEIQIEVIANQWHQIIQKKIVPNYHQWKKSFWIRLYLFVTRLIFYPKLLRFIFRDAIKKSYS
jgi:glycosyltransferase involved in cell wall biosynthesis